MAMGNNKISDESVRVADAETGDVEQDPNNFFEDLKLFCKKLINTAGLKNFNEKALQSELDKKNLASLSALIVALAEKYYELRNKEAVPSNSAVRVFAAKFSDASVSEHKVRAESVANAELATSTAEENAWNTLEKRVARDLGRSIIIPCETLATDDELHKHLRKVLPELFETAVTCSVAESDLLLERFILPSLAIFAGLNVDSTMVNGDAFEALLNMMRTLARSCKQGMYLSAAATAAASPTNANANVTSPTPANDGRISGTAETAASKLKLSKRRTL